MPYGEPRLGISGYSDMTLFNASFRTVGPNGDGVAFEFSHIGMSAAVMSGGVK